MYLNDFSVRIPEGVETSGGYVEMRHGQVYRLVLHNGRSVRCDARVEIDGKHVGTWRINAYQSITLERPVHDQGRFTFYKLGTPEASQVGLSEHDPNLGLVKVTFTPEAQIIYTVTTSYYTAQPKGLEPQWQTTYDSGTSRSYAGQSRSAGGTGLSGHSGQEFTNADYITYDYTQETVIHLRLVAVNGESGPRPLTSFSTPVPPRIG